MKRILSGLLLIAGLVFWASCNPKLSNGLRKKDRLRDVEVVTTRGTLVIRLSDSTPLHRDNFLLLVKKGYYDKLLFHRVIRNFMIQTGDPDSREGRPGKPLSQGGSGGPGYTIPAEFRPELFHHRGAVGAARTNDDVNPTRASSGSQFYIVQGKRFTDPGLDSLENGRLKGRKIPAAHREVYKEAGGSPHLDQAYTVFGEVIRGMEVVDSIAATATSGPPLDRPKTEIRILKMKLIARDK
ncbi:peptidylprolyl isomerase [Puia sp.]|jgi:peptidyl-prolyl cis-trans isomerase B (cyclophilin B)|uniref:peptidylprolyl isomerase n=1 Tax=Puia sp. TaxID=2045100 RepID=UPI002F3E7E2B